MAQMELVMKAAGFKEVKYLVGGHVSHGRHTCLVFLSHAGALPVHAENNVKIDRRIREVFGDPVRAHHRCNFRHRNAELPFGEDSQNVIGFQRKRDA